VRREAFSETRWRSAIFTSAMTLSSGQRTASYTHTTSHVHLLNLDLATCSTSRNLLLSVIGCGLLELRRSGAIVSLCNYSFLSGTTRCNGHDCRLRKWTTARTRPCSTHLQVLTAPETMSHSMLLTVKTNHSLSRLQLQCSPSPH
jgi:hypothetical protein